ncbi:hypothetical protein ACIBQ1_26625 [Nonomuraea sp. NPDC050153]
MTGSPVRRVVAEKVRPRLLARGGAQFARAWSFNWLIRSPMIK